MRINSIHSISPRPAVAKSEAANFKRIVVTSEWTLLAAAREQLRAELQALVQAVQWGATDPAQLTDLIFYARHPDLLEVRALSPERIEEWNTISTLLVQPTLDGLNAPATTTDHSQAEVAPVGAGAEQQFDHLIAQSTTWCPGLSSALLKGLLAQESGLDPQVINQYGYAGIAQLGRREAHEVGLSIGIAGSRGDERLDPQKAIPAAARLLHLKAQRLSELAFARYGQPTGKEFWKFALGAYNGGEATITLAMGQAYRNGVATARARGLTGLAVVDFARQQATQWDNLKTGGLASPLGLAATRYFPSLAFSKYHEIGSYPTKVVARASTFARQQVE